MECQRWKVWVSISKNERCVACNPAVAAGETDNVKPDDRFIAKEISRPELQTMETFAPAYFDYMSSAVSANVCTVIVAITLPKEANRHYISVAAPYSSRQSLWMLQVDFPQNFG